MVKVSSVGKLTPVKVGTATVTVVASANDNWKRAAREVTVTVTKGTPKVTASDKTVAMGKTASLGAAVTAGAGALSYRSSDASVVKVSSAGKLTPVKVGTATVTVVAPANDNWKRATREVAVTVTKGMPTIKATDKTVALGGVASLGATVTAGAGTLSYRSSDTAVVRVSSTGRLTPLRRGNATITITAAANENWNAKTKKVTVTVV